MPDENPASAQVRAMLSDALRAVQKLDGVVHAYYAQPPWDHAPRQENSVQEHVRVARRHLNDALKELIE